MKGTSICSRINDGRTLKEFKYLTDMFPHIDPATVLAAVFFNGSADTFKQKPIEEQKSIIDNFFSEAYKEDATERETYKLGINSKNTATNILYRHFAHAVPADLRLESMQQLSSLFSEILSDVITGINIPERQALGYLSKKIGPSYQAYADMVNAIRSGNEDLFKNMSRSEILSILGKVNASITGENKAIPSGANVIFKLMYDRLKGIQKDLYDELDLQHNPSPKFDPDSVKGRQFIRFHALSRILDNGNWIPSVYMAQRSLLATEKLKCGAIKGEPFAQFLDDLEQGVFDNPSADPLAPQTDVEETTLEHWMMKADTISGYGSMSAEVRRLISNLRTKGKGILGISETADPGLIYSTLMGICAKYQCTNSDDFLHYIKLEASSDESDLADSTKFALKQLCKKVIPIVSKSGISETPRDMQTKAALKSLLFDNFNKATILYTIPERTRTQNGEIEVHLQREGSEQGKMFTENVARSLPVITNEEESIFKKDGFLNRTRILGLRHKIINRFDNTGWIPSLRAEKESGVEDNLKRKIQEANANGDFIVAREATEELERLYNSRETIINTILNDTLLGVSGLHIEVDKLKKDVDALITFLNIAERYLTELNNTPTGSVNINNNKGKIYPIQNEWFDSLSKESFSIGTTKALSPEAHTYFNHSSYFPETSQFALSIQLRAISSLLKRGNRDQLKKYLEEHYLNNRLYAIKTGKEGSETYEIRHPWIKELYEYATDSSKNIDRDTYLSKIQEGLIMRGLGMKEGYVPFEDFTEKENMDFQILHFMEGLASSNGKFGFIPTFVLGDADSVRYIPATTLDTKSNAYKLDFVEVLKEEMKVASQFEEFDKHCASNGYGVVKKGGKLSSNRVFTFFPELNDRLNERLKGLESEEEIREAKNKFFTEIKDFIKDNGELKAYDMYCKDSIENGFKGFINFLQKKGMIVTVQGKHTLKGSMFPSSYMSMLNKMSSENVSPLKALYMNMKFGEICHIQFSGISPAFYDGTMDMQKRWKEIIASGNPLDPTAIDSNGEHIFEIVDGVRQFNQRVAYFEDEVADTTKEADGSESLLNKLLNKKGINPKPYKKSSVTDGQAYRSFTSYRKIMIAKGEWWLNPNNEIVYQTIMSRRAAGAAAINKYLRENYPTETFTLNEALDRGIIPAEVLEESELTAEERAIISKANVTFQPLKPFYYGMESIELNDGSVMQVPVQHKYSEWVLIPELLPKDEASANLRMMGKAMDANGIDLLASTKCAKVGGWGQAKLDFSSQGKINECLSSNTCKHHTLGLEGFIIQTNVPYHGSSPRGEGTQVRKILGYLNLAVPSNKKFSGFTEAIGIGRKLVLGDDKEIDFSDSEGVKPEDCMEAYNAMQCANWVNQGAKHLERMSSVTNRTLMAETCIMNDSRTSNDALLGLSLIEGTEERIVPMSEGITSSDFWAKFISVFRKDVVKQVSEGGTAVQIAPLGFGLEMVFDPECYECEYEEYEENGETKKKFKSYKFDEKGNRIIKKNADPSNLLYAEGLRTFDFSYIGANGRRIELKYEDYVYPVTGRLLKEDGTVCRQGEEDQSKLNKEFPGMYDALAYRVPTERAYSAINIRFVKFLPKTLGAVVAVPEAYTTIAGFDFDIDKLYFMFPSFVLAREENYDDEDKIKIWNYIYANHKDIEAKLQVARANDTSTIKKPLNQYWEDAKIEEDKNDIFANAVSQLYYNYGDARDRFVQYNGRALHTNPHHVIDNMKLRYYLDRLQDPETLMERLTPGGFHNIESDTAAMQRLTRHDLKGIFDVNTLFSSEYEYPNDDPSDIVTINHYQTANVIYGQLIGKAANQNISQTLVAMTKTFKLKKPILFGSMIEREAKCGLGLLGSDLRARYKDGDENNGTDSNLLLAELLAASVDAVKNATLEFFGITPKTFNIAATAIRLGANFRDVGLLLNQPVVKEALALLERGESTSFDSALNDALELMMRNTDFRDTVNSSYKSRELNQSVLYDSIRNYRGGHLENGIIDGSLLNADLVTTQKAVVATLSELGKAASELTALVQGSRQDSSNAIESTSASMERLIYSAEALARQVENPDSKFLIEINEDGDPLYSFDNLYDEEGNVSMEVLRQMHRNPFAIPQMILHQAKAFLDSSKSEFLSQTPVFKEGKKILNALVKREVAPLDMLKAFDEDFPIYLLHHISATADIPNVAPEFNPFHKVMVYNEGDIDEEGHSKGTEVNMRTFIKKFYPNMLNNLFNKYPEIKKRYAIFDNIEIKQGKRGISYISFKNVSISEGTSKEYFMDSWDAALHDENPEVRAAARMLFFHNFYTRGLGAFSQNTCNTLIPVSIKQEIEGYLDWCREFMYLNYNRENGTIYIDRNGEITTFDEGTAPVLGNFIQLLLLNRGFNDYNYSAQIGDKQFGQILKLNGAKADDLSMMPDGLVALDMGKVGTIYNDLEFYVDSSCRPIVIENFRERRTPDGELLRVAESEGEENEGSIMLRVTPVLRVKDFNSADGAYSSSVRTYILDTNYRNYEHDSISEEEEGNRLNLFSTVEHSYNDGPTKVTTRAAKVRYKLVEIGEGSRTNPYTRDYSDFNGYSEEESLDGYYESSDSIVFTDGSGFESESFEDSFTGNKEDNQYTFIYQKVVETLAESLLNGSVTLKIEYGPLGETEISYVSEVDGRSVDVIDEIIKQFEDPSLSDPEFNKRKSRLIFRDNGLRGLFASIKDMLAAVTKNGNELKVVKSRGMAVSGFEGLSPCCKRAAMALLEEAELAVILAVATEGSVSSAAENRKIIKDAIIRSLSNYISKVGLETLGANVGNSFGASEYYGWNVAALEKLAVERNLCS